MKNTFKKAHEITRKMVSKYGVNYRTQFAISLSFLLNEKEAETTLTTKVKRWFVEKNFTSNEQYLVDISDTGIVKETEKAVLLKFTSDHGAFTKWIPKSCLITEEEYLQEKKREEEKYDRFFEGERKYNKLVKFAKENGVKGVRVGLRKQTIIRKINEIGLVAPKELIA